MSREKQIEEMAKSLNRCASVCEDGCSCSEKEHAEALYNAGYRKQSEGEWVKKHRHRGGYETVTGVDSIGEKHTITLDTRCEYDDLYCSICGKQAADNFLNYCPNCGAKMKGGAE